MYSRKDRIFDCFTRNSTMLNSINVLTVATITGLFTTSFFLPAVILVSLFLFYICFCEIYMRRLKDAGSLEINQSALKWTMENNSFAVEAEDIRKIVIRKEFFFSLLCQRFEFVLIEIVRKDHSISDLALRKHSKDSHEFNVFKSLKLFSEHNGIALEK